jgi:hypothetical protein
MPVSSTARKSCRTKIEYIVLYRQKIQRISHGVSPETERLRVERAVMGRVPWLVRAELARRDEVER